MKCANVTTIYKKAGVPLGTWGLNVIVVKICCVFIKDSIVNRRLVITWMYIGDVLVESNSELPWDNL